jgi:long-chain acyl-CoA synthetase
MIVTPEGLNVFPEDVERVVNDVAGVRESAAVGVTQNGEERVQVALVVAPGTNPADVVKAAQRAACRPPEDTRGEGMAWGSAPHALKARRN